MIFETREQLREILPADTRIIDLFDELGRGGRFLILGEPGSGKTIVLMELAKELITRAEQNPQLPIPAVFNLSTWASEKRILSISDWLIKELQRIYGVSKELSKAWVKHEQLLLLLDGLDEVKAERRDACIQAINKFIENNGRTEMIVTSRQKDYEILPSRLKLQFAICLQSLTSKQINFYLNTAGEKFQGVKTALQRDATLREIVKTPLMLSVVTVAYEGASIESFPKNKSKDSIRKDIFDSYIEKMLDRRGAIYEQYVKKQIKHGLRYPREQTRRWLIGLAKLMRKESQSIFLIEEMQPDLLQYKLQKSLYLLFLGLSHAIPIAMVFVSSPLIVMVAFKHVSLYLLNFIMRIGIITFLFSMCMGIFNSCNLFKKPIIEKIKPVETLKWSWNKFCLSLPIVLVSYLVAIWLAELFVKAQFMPTLISIPTTPEQSLTVTKSALNNSALFFLFSSAMHGPKLNIEKKTFPNQGIRRSTANAVIFALVFGLPVALFFASLGWSSFKLTGALMGALMGYVCIGLWIGITAGKPCLQHFSLRLILCYNKYIPWNYARFLDFADEMILLQKVGGGYTFIHRLLLEHFAKMKP